MAVKYDKILGALREQDSSSGGGASVTLAWKFDTTTTAGAASGRMRFNNATPASVTEIYLSDTTNSGADVSTILAQLTGVKFYMQSLDDATKYTDGSINTVTDNTTYFTLGVTIADSGTLPSNNEIVGSVFFSAGSNPFDQDLNTTNSVTFASANIGNVAGGNYLQIDSTGKVYSYGLARKHDDIYVSATGLSAGGTAPPVWKQFINDGVAGTDSAVSFNTTAGNQAGNMTAYTALDNVISGSGTQQYAIEFWIKPTTVDYRYIVEFGSNCGIRLDNVGGNPGFRIDFGSTRTFAHPGLVVNAWNHVVINADHVAGTFDVYANNVKISQTMGTQGTTPHATYEWGYGTTSTAVPNYSLDYFTVYNQLLTEAQITARYNNGSFSAALPSGLTDSNRVLYLDFEDGTGNTVTNTKGNSLILGGTAGVDFSWVTGAIGATGSFGIYLPTFSSGLRQHAGFTVPFPHSYDIGTDVEPHIHWSITEAMSAGETIKFGLEYTTAEPGATFPTTNTIYLTYTAPTGGRPANYHFEVPFDELIDMSAIVSDSPQLSGTIWRDTDTFAGDVYFMNFGVHYYGDSLGY